MTDAHRPGGAIRPAARQIEIAAGIDRVVLQRSEFVRRHVDGQALGHPSQIEDQWTIDRDRLAFRVDMDVAKADRTAGIDAALDQTPRAMVAVEAAFLHRPADRRVERAAAFCGHRQRELHCLVEHCADRHRHADAAGELHQFAGRVESRAARLDAMEPVECGPDEAGTLPRHLDGDRRVHQHFRADAVVVSHDSASPAAFLYFESADGLTAASGAASTLAFASASTTPQ